MQDPLRGASYTLLVSIKFYHVCVIAKEEKNKKLAGGGGGGVAIPCAGKKAYPLESLAAAKNRKCRYRTRTRPKK